MAIDVVVVLLGLVLTCPDLTLGGASTSPFISKGGGEVTRKVTESVTT
jgi:hypothetical protein